MSLTICIIFCALPSHVGSTQHLALIDQAARGKIFENDGRRRRRTDGPLEDAYTISSPCEHNCSGENPNTSFKMLLNTTEISRNELLVNGHFNNLNVLEYNCKEFFFDFIGCLCNIYS